MEIYSNQFTDYQSEQIKLDVIGFHSNHNHWGNFFGKTKNSAKCMCISDVFE